MTESTPSVVHEDTSSVQRTVRIRASRDKVWAALTRAELISQWFGQTARIDDLSVGGTGVIGWEGWGNYPIAITEVEPPTVFAFRWGAAEEPVSADHSTLCRFTLVAEGEDTILTVVESGFETIGDDREAQLANLDEHREGWDEELDELVALLESA